MLDAPDLMTPSQKVPGFASPWGPGSGRLNGGQHKGVRRGAIAERTVQCAGKAGSSSSSAMLGAEASAMRRLVAEQMPFRAARMPPCGRFGPSQFKTGSRRADAQRLEEAFQARLARFAGHSEGGRRNTRIDRAVPAIAGSGETSRPPIQRPRGDGPGGRRSPSSGRDPEGSTGPFWHCRGRAGFGTALTFSTSPTSLPEVQSPACDAHHLRFSQPRTLRRP